MRLTAGRSLTLETFADACSEDGSDQTHVDLSPVEFVDAFGLVGVACALAAAGTRGHRAHVRLPSDPDVTRYLARMHLQRSLAGIGVSASGNLPRVREHDQAGNLVVLHRFDDLRGGEQLAELIFDRLEGQVDNAVTTALYEAVVELCANTAEHAESPLGGFLCAQTYQRGTPDEYVVFGVGDPGIGLRSSLSRLHGPIDDSEAVELALRRDVSGTGRPGRGQGLAEIIDTGSRLGGRVGVHSGTAVTTCTRRGRQSGASAELLGTLVGARLPCRPGRRR